jgi:hypothetical protein
MNFGGGQVQVVSCSRSEGHPNAHQGSEVSWARLSAMTLYREMDMQFWLERAEANMRELT